LHQFVEIFFWSRAEAQNLEAFPLYFLYQTNANAMAAFRIGVIAKVQ
jgi:hypothetical protein